MDARLSIFRKGLVLVAIPLLSQLLFLTVLTIVRSGRESAQRWALHTKEVIARAEAAHRLIVEAQNHMRGFALTGDPAFEERFRQVRSSAPAVFEQLRLEVGENEDQARRVERISERANDALAWMDENCRLIHAGKQAEVVGRIKNQEGARALDTLRELTDSFLAEEDRLDRQRDQELERTANLQTIILICGFILAVGSSCILLVLFSQGIANRLGVLTENTRRLAEGKELAPPLVGKDELARLDRVFHDMADALRQKEQENEMFVYSVSHDLRSPLVNLQGFSQELAHICRDLRELFVRADMPAEIRDRGLNLLDENAAEDVRYIQSAVSRLGSIIEGLLRLSRVGRVEYRQQAVDLEATVRRVVQSLKDSISRRGAEVELKRMPAAWGDPAALDQVFANLVTNAVHYLDPARPGKIEVGLADGEAAGRAPGLHVYYVKDNGLGIPEKFQNKVFLAFQRLHPQAAEGEGMGLTLVRRIVERHGGKVWVHSREGEGSTFYVALPPLESGEQAREV